MKDRLVEVGEPFLVDLEARERKMRENRRKLWNHRAGLVYKYLLSPWLPQTLCYGFFLSVTGIWLTAWGYSAYLIANHFSMGPEGQAWMIATAMSMALGAIPLSVILWPSIAGAFKNVAIEWDAPSLPTGASRR